MTQKGEKKSNIMNKKRKNVVSFDVSQPEVPMSSVKFPLFLGTIS